MPAALDSDGYGKAAPCARCHASNAALVIRSERLCRDCFVKYVETKVFKRLEKSGIRSGFNDLPKILLLPISFGVSSISLLHVLDQQLQHRLKQGRHAGYTLHVLFIDESNVVAQPSFQDSVGLLKQRFPSHVYSVISLEQCFHYGISFTEALGIDSLAIEKKDQDNVKDLQNMISALPSATSKTDIVDIIRRRLITEFARRQACDSIIFADSTTRLAERSLSETAKGRGGFLPLLTADGASVDGLVCNYPMRDLLRKELNLYADVASPPLRPLIAPPQTTQGTVSSKDATIDGLMSQYFQSVEENYPSIVANVVRTTSKLTPRPENDSRQFCNLCRRPITNNVWGGDQGDSIPESSLEYTDPEDSNVLCYGCIRTVEHP